LDALSPAPLGLVTKGGMHEKENATQCHLSNLLCSHEGQNIGIHPTEVEQESEKLMPELRFKPQTSPSRVPTANTKPKVTISRQKGHYPQKLRTFKSLGD